MTDGTAADSPLEAAAGGVGERATEAFAILSNETRLAILLALWEAQDPGPSPSEPVQPGVSFADLRDRVGIDDPNQLTYHLQKLAGPFVDQTDAGYTLTAPAEQVLHAVMAGTLTDPPSLEGEPVDSECVHCGGTIVIDYSDGVLVERCTSCEGTYQQPDQPAGMVSKGYRPPTALANRTPREFHRQGRTWTRYRMHSMIEGACPDCSGTVTTTVHVCENHDTHDGTVCDHCGALWRIRTLFVCDVCKNALQTPARAPIFTEVAVTAFFYDHGLDPDALYDAASLEVIDDAIERTDVVSEDPLEVAVTVELDGDRLTATLDDDAHVIDVTEER